MARVRKCKWCGSPAPTGIRLCADCAPARNAPPGGVLNRANSATAERMMRDHWGKPATIAQALALLAQWDAQLTQERIQRSHEISRERRRKERESRKRSA